MNRKLIEYKEIAPGMVRIESPIEGLLTLDRYIYLARDLLENGLNKFNSNEELKDMNFPELVDNMLLYQELEEQSQSEVKQVSFIYGGKEYMVNLSNIDRIITKEPVVNEYSRIINDSVQELFEK